MSKLADALMCNKPPSLSNSFPWEASIAIVWFSCLLTNSNLEGMKSHLQPHLQKTTQPSTRQILLLNMLRSTVLCNTNNHQGTDNCYQRTEVKIPTADQTAPYEKYGYRASAAGGALICRFLSSCSGSSTSGDLACVSLLLISFVSASEAWAGGWLLTALA